MWTRRGVFAALAAAMFVTTTPSWASSPATTGSVHGVITGQQGGLQLPQVSITLRSQSNGDLVRVGATDLRGAFRFDEVPAGLYELEATHPGFEAVTVERVMVIGGSVRREHVTLPEKSAAPSRQT